MSRQTNKLNPSKKPTPVEQPVQQRGETPVLAHVDELPFIPTGEEVSTVIATDVVDVVETVVAAPEIVVVAEPAPPVVAAPPEPRKEPTTVHEYFAQRYPNMVELPVGIVGVIDTMEAYNHAMHPSRPIEPRAAVQFQRALHYCFLNALGLPGRQSQMALDAILWYFNKGRDGAFSQYLIFRTLPARSMSPSEMSSLRMMLHLFYNTSDPATRKANLRSMVDIRKIVETLPTPKTRESLLNFYA